MMSCASLARPKTTRVISVGRQIHSLVGIRHRNVT
jgi:hypothetical protein